MRYEEFAPGPGLEDYIASLWAFSVPPDGPSVDHVVPPDGCVSLVLVRPPAPGEAWLTVVGPRVEAHCPPVAPGWSYWGVRFQPGAAESVLGLSAQSLRDRVMPLSPGAPEWTARLLGLLRTAACPEQAACIFEGFVAYRLQQAPPLDPLVQVAARQMIEAHGSVSVRSLALRSGLGERQFRRRFTPAVGLLPKEFARVRRLRWACVRMVLERQSLVDLAGQSGFADQAHLSREFVSVVGAAPASFAERLRRIELGRLDG